MLASPIILFLKQYYTTTKKRLYVRSRFLYGSQILRPLQLKGIKPIESVCRATKFILNDYTSDYRSRLIKLHILPLSMLLELSDICFFVRSLKLVSFNISFNISNYTQFSQNPNRSKSYSKLVQSLVKNNRDKQFYFLTDCLIYRTQLTATNVLKYTRSVLEWCILLT